MRNNTSISPAGNTELTGVVPATYVDLLYDYLATHNHDAVQFLGPKPVANKGIGRYPVADWKLMLQTAAASLNDPMLGLHLGQTISPKHLGVLGYVLLSCGTLGAALQRLQQYHQLIYDVNPMEMTNSGSKITLVWGQTMGRPGPLVDETAISALVQFCRDIIAKPNYSPVSVAFINPTPPTTKPYQEYFGCPVEFEQAETRVTIELADLQTPLRTADSALIQILEQQANAMLSELPSYNSTPFSTEIQALVVSQLHQSEPSAASIADLLNVTTRTLNRRLATEKTSFRHILQQTRHQLAMDYLQDPRLQLAEIALLLAYSEQSAFNRAFKAWQGQTPAQYRRQNQ